MTNNTAALADAYAALKYEEEALKARIETLRAEILEAAGDSDKIVGDTCVVAIVEKKGAETMDKKAAILMLQSLGATPEQIASLTKVGKPSRSLTIKAKLSMAV